MTKETLGLSLPAAALIAFLFCLLQQPLAVLLVVGFALLVLKDAWLNRQVIQALFLTIAYYAAAMLVGWIFGGLATLFGFLELYSAQRVLLTVNSFATGIVYILLIVFSILAILRVLRGRDAGLPFSSKLIDGGLSAATQATQWQAAPPAPQAPFVPPAPVSYSAPTEVSYAAPTEVSYSPPTEVSYSPPTEASYAAPAAESETAGRRCTSCGTPLQGESRFCTECGAKNE